MLNYKRTQLLLSLAMFALVPTLSHAQANGLRSAGTATYVKDEWAFYPCAGLQCTPASDYVDRQMVGTGAIATADLLSLVAPGDNHGGSVAKASATLLGPLGLAQLRALASTHQGLGTPPGYSDPNAFFYSADAFANSVQLYTVGGVGSSHFTFSYSLDAYLRSTVLSSLPNARISAGIAAFLVEGVSLEFPLGKPMLEHQVSFDGTDGDFLGYVTGGGSISFNLSAGQQFHLVSFLSVSVLSGEGDTVSDSYNTMNVALTEGDQSILTTALPGAPVTPTTVPEPATWLLMATGLAAITVMTRRRKAA